MAAGGGGVAGGGGDLDVVPFPRVDVGIAASGLEELVVAILPWGILAVLDSASMMHWVDFEGGA